MDTRDGLHRLDSQILLEVGGAQTLLRRPAGERAMRMLPVHDIPGIGALMVDGAGFVEAITYSMFVHLVRDRKDANDFVDAAMVSGSIPLLSRLRSVLDYIRLGSTESDVQCWAENAYATRVDPALTHLIDRVIIGLDAERSAH